MLSSFTHPCIIQSIVEFQKKIFKSMLCAKQHWSSLTLYGQKKQNTKTFLEIAPVVSTEESQSYWFGTTGGRVNERIFIYNLQKNSDTFNYLLNAFTIMLLWLFIKGIENCSKALFLPW